MDLAVRLDFLVPVVHLQLVEQVEIVDRLAHLVYQGLLVQQVFQVQVEAVGPLETVELAV